MLDGHQHCLSCCWYCEHGSCRTNMAWPQGRCCTVCHECAFISLSLVFVVFAALLGQCARFPCVLGHICGIVSVDDWCCVCCILLALMCVMWKGPQVVEMRLPGASTVGARTPSGDCLSSGVVPQISSIVLVANVSSCNEPLALLDGPLLPTSSSEQSATTPKTRRRVKAPGY